MTELEFSDSVGVTVKTVAARRVAVGLVERNDFTVAEDGVTYTEAGLAKMQEAFGLPAGATGDASVPQEGSGVMPTQDGAAVWPEVRTLTNAPVVLCKVLRALPSESTRNNRHFMAVVIDGMSMRATERVLGLLATRLEPCLASGRILKVLDFRDSLVLDRSELRRRGECLR